MIQHNRQFITLFTFINSNVVEFFLPTATCILLPKMVHISSYTGWIFFSLILYGEKRVLFGHKFNEMSSANETFRLLLWVNWKWLISYFSIFLMKLTTFKHFLKFSSIQIAPFKITVSIKFITSVEDKLLETKVTFNSLIICWHFYF